MTGEKPTQDDIAQLTLKHLQEFRHEFRDFRHNVADEFKDVKFRLRQIEEGIAHHTTQFDRINERITRIENRLDLVDAE
jgi:tetrahydromethanopterin S-methyltransferase subunit G